MLRVIIVVHFSMHAANSSIIIQTYRCVCCVLHTGLVQAVSLGCVIWNIRGDVQLVDMQLRN